MKMSEQWVVDSDHTKKMFLLHCEKMYEEHKHLTFTVKTGKQRTNQQNKALHKYLQMLADRLNDAGLDMKKTLKPEIDIPWNVELAKQYLWKPIQKAMIGKESTTKADRSEYTIVYETLNRHTAGRFGISLPWPSKDER